MDKDRACQIINNEIITARGVRLEGKGHDRTDDGVVLAVIFRPMLSQNPPDYPVRAKNPVASRHVIRVGDIDTREDLLTRVVDVLIACSSHEIREFTRLRPHYDAPVHPHRGEGIERWATAHGTDPALDYTFGVV